MIICTLTLVPVLQSSPTSPQSPPGPLARLLQPTRIGPEVQGKTIGSVSSKRMRPPVTQTREQPQVAQSRHDSRECLSGDDGVQGCQETPRDVSEEFDVVFFLGDLNYRCVISRFRGLEMSFTLFASVLLNKRAGPS